MRVLFLGKKGDPQAESAAEFTKLNFSDTKIVWGRRGDDFPKELTHWKGDYIFSYLFPWIIPKFILENAKNGGINWHPGPPEYPGIGCTNFAVYNHEKQYGITCHYMEEKVDTGGIIEVQRFEVSDSDTVYSITQKCYTYILKSYYGIIEKIAQNESLPLANETWKRKPYTRKELDALCIIKPDMEWEEIQRRVKATKYDRHWAYVEIKGMKFYSRD